MASKELAIVKADSFAVLNPQKMNTIVQSITDGSLQPHNLLKIDLPTGARGGLGVPGRAGVEEHETVEGVIVYKRPARFLYKNPYDKKEKGEIPICQSHLVPDEMNTALVEMGIKQTFTEFGRGDPGGLCMNCPMAQFGANSEIPKCSKRFHVYLLIPGNTLPYLLQIPPTGLKNWGNFMMRLATTDTDFKSIITRFSLEAAENASGTAYMKISEMTVVSILDAAADAQMQQYIAQIGPWLANVQPTDDSYTTTEEPVGDPTPGPEATAPSDDNMPF